MSKLHQLHDRYGQSPWLDNLTRGDITSGHPVYHRAETDVFPGSTTDKRSDDMTKLQRLYQEQGQSPWLDNLTRAYLRDGTLGRLVADGVRG